MIHDHSTKCCENNARHNSPISQCMPSKPGWQSHVYSPTPSTHAPCTHSLLTHSSIAVKVNRKCQIDSSDFITQVKTDSCLIYF